MAVSITSSTAMNSRTRVSMARQEVSTQRGVIKVVSKTSGRLIPSTPRL